MLKNVTENIFLVLILLSVSAFGEISKETEFTVKEINSSDVVNSETLTVSMCIKLDSLDENQVLLEKYVWTESGFYIKYEKTQGLYVEVFDGSGERRVANYGKIKAGKWYNIGFVADGERLFAYKNGIETGAAYSYKIVANELPLTIPANNGLFIEDLEIFDYPLSIQEFRVFISKYTITKYFDFVPDDKIDAFSLSDEQLREKSNLVDGEFSRLQRVFAKAQRGEDITIGTIGGSITMGAAATNPERRFSNHIAKWICDKYPDITVRLYNSGIGATNSMFGAFRAQKHLLKYEPDLVVVEYSINDSANEDAYVTIEGLLRQILTSEKGPAVVMLAMMNAWGKNVQDRHTAVAEYYGIPFVSFRDVFGGLLEQKKIEADQILADSVHPNDAGHDIAAKLVTLKFEQALTAKKQKGIAIPSKPLYADRFQNVEFLEAGNIQPKKVKGWELQDHSRSAGPWRMNGRELIEKVWAADKIRSGFEFEYEGTFLAISYWRLNGDMGIAKVLVDGKEYLNLDGWGEQKWGGYAITNVGGDLAHGIHKVKIIVDEKNAQSNGYNFDLIAISVGKGSANTSISKKYSFYKKISKEVLQNYLDRAVTQGELCQTKDDGVFYEDLRMLRNIGAKFIGRAGFIWTPQMHHEEQFSLLKKRVKQAHLSDPEFVLQCCIFEAVYESNNELTEFGVDLVPVPEFVFNEFGVSVEKRNFNYEAMIYQDGTYVNRWVKGASVPDMSQLETRMYFYYLATRYIDLGFEAIHFGQVMLMDHNDSNHKYWFETLGRIRGYAKENARRGFVLCDASNAGVVEDGKLLFDWHSYVLRPKEICGQSYKAMLEIGFEDSIYGMSKGGLTPSGWICKSLPYLIEFDNSGASNPGVCGGKEWWWPWGWDEISWYAHCDEQYRDVWLIYAHNWIKENAPIGRLQMPGSITIAADPIGDVSLYKINRKSKNCPMGFGQEKTVEQIWKN